MRIVKALMVVVVEVGSLGVTTVMAQWPPES
jgi:hypothetical protein